MASNSVTFDPEFETEFTTGGSGSGGSGQGSLVATSGYRYGFNGKENDNEVKGEGNQQDYGMRIYDPRIGRFLSVDPLTRDFPWYTPYQFAGNMPILAIDMDGLEPVPRIKQIYSYNNGESIMVVADVTIHIKIINLSKIANGQIDMNSLRAKTKSLLDDALSGEGKSMANGYFGTEKLGEGLAKVKSLKNSINQTVTFKVDVVTDVRVINSLDEIGENDWVFAIVDKVITDKSEEALGLAQFGGKVAIGDASAFVGQTLPKYAPNLVAHEVSHLLGAYDTYIDPAKKSIPNLMNTLGDLNNGKLDSQQLGAEVWQSVLGTWDYIWKGVQGKAYRRPLGVFESEHTRSQLLKFISTNGKSDKIK